MDEVVLDLFGTVSFESSLLPNIPKKPPLPLVLRVCRLDNLPGSRSGVGNSMGASAGSGGSVGTSVVISLSGVAVGGGSAGLSGNGSGSGSVNLIRFTGGADGGSDGAKLGLGVRSCADVDCDRGDGASRTCDELRERDGSRPLNVVEDGGEDEDDVDELLIVCVCNNKVMNGRFKVSGFCAPTCSIISLPSMLPPYVPTPGPTAALRGLVGCLRPKS